MSLPGEHVTRLHEDLSAHETRLEHLRRRIAMLTEEAFAHELIIALGRSPSLIETLAAVQRNPDLARELTLGPERFLGDYGITVPTGAHVLVDGEGDTFVASLRVTHGEWEYTCVWDAAEGFSLIQHRIPGLSPGDSRATEES